MGKKAANFRAWQYQNPHGIVKDAWNAAWDRQSALQYSRTIQEKDAEIERLKELVSDAYREGYETAREHPEDRPGVAVGWEESETKAALAGKEEKP